LVAQTLTPEWALPGPLVGVPHAQLVMPLIM
jgi:hypothetical protein